MGRLSQLLAAAAVFFALGASPTLADTPLRDGALLSIHTLGAVADYPALSRGQVVFINARRFVVTQEPVPVAKSLEPPPEPELSELERPTEPYEGAIWVEGHWSYGAASGFAWVAGRYVAPRSGHAFVPPRWAVLEEQYFFFTGFYVPYGVYVRSHFNRYYYSGAAKTGSRSAHGPYWPVGAPTRARSPLTSAGARDPYWPIGVRR